MGSVCSSTNNYQPTPQELQAMKQAKDQYPLHKLQLRDINKEPISVQKKIIQELESEYRKYATGNIHYTNIDSQVKKTLYENTLKKRKKLRKTWNKEEYTTKTVPLAGGKLKSNKKIKRNKKK